MGACMFTLVSQYGFAKADQARVAASVASGVGFIGAGVSEAFFDRRFRRAGRRDWPNNEKARSRVECLLGKTVVGELREAFRTQTRHDIIAEGAYFYNMYDRGYQYSVIEQTWETWNAPLLFFYHQAGAFCLFFFQRSVRFGRKV